MLRKGSNIQLLNCFFSFSQKSKYFMPNGKKFQFSTHCRKMYIWVKIIFSLCLSNRKKITALPQTFLSGNTFSDSPSNNPFHYSPLSQNTSSVSKVFFDGSQPAVQWQTHLWKSYHIYFQSRISTKSFWFSHYSFNNNTPPSSSPPKKPWKIPTNQANKQTLPLPPPKFPNLSPTNPSFNS